MIKNIRTASKGIIMTYIGFFLIKKGVLRQIFSTVLKWLNLDDLFNGNADEDRNRTISIGDLELDLPFEIQIEKPKPKKKIKIPSWVLKISKIKLTQIVPKVTQIGHKVWNKIKRSKEPKDAIIKEIIDLSDIITSKEEFELSKDDLDSFEENL